MTDTTSLALVVVFGILAVAVLGIVAMVFNRSLIMSLKGLLSAEHHPSVPVVREPPAKDVPKA